MVACHSFWSQRNTFHIIYVFSLKGSIWYYYYYHHHHHRLCYNTASSVENLLFLLETRIHKYIRILYFQDPTPVVCDAEKARALRKRNAAHKRSLTKSIQLRAGLTPTKSQIIEIIIPRDAFDPQHDTYRI